MKIYVSHSRHFEYKNELYSVLEDSGLDHKFIFPHKETDVPFDSKNLIQGKSCDLILAEVSHPATGQGIELGWADAYEIPIICICKKGSEISGSLKVVCNEIIEYEDDLIEKLKEGLKRYG